MSTRRKIASLEEKANKINLSHKFLEKVNKIKIIDELFEEN